MAGLKSLAYCDVIFKGIKKNTHNGYDIVFLKDGVEQRLPYYYSSTRTKEDRKFDKYVVGKIGSIQPVVCCRGYWFEIYTDQSLRRAPELDMDQIDIDQNPEIIDTIGWRNERNPQGFRSPEGIIPNGITPKQTTSERITLDIPQRFETICEQYHLSPEQILQDFIEGVCIQTTSQPSLNPDREFLLTKHYLQARYGKAEEQSI